MDSVYFKIEGIDKIVEKLGQFIEPEKIDAIVKESAMPYVTELAAAYRKTYGETKSTLRRQHTMKLANSVDAFRRQRSGSMDPFFTYYVGPRWTGGGKASVGGGNAAYWMEYGTVMRHRANAKKGGVGKTLKDKKTGFTDVYGEKISTGKVAGFAIIRRLIASNRSNTSNTLGNKISSYIGQRATQLGFK